MKAAVMLLRVAVLIGPFLGLEAKKTLGFGVAVVDVVGRVPEIGVVKD